METQAKEQLQQSVAKWQTEKQANEELIAQMKENKERRRKEMEEMEQQKAQWLSEQEEDRKKEKELLDNINSLSYTKPRDQERAGVIQPPPARARWVNPARELHYLPVKDGRMYWTAMNTFNNEKEEELEVRFEKHSAEITEAQAKLADFLTAKDIEGEWRAKVTAWKGVEASISSARGVGEDVQETRMREKEFEDNKTKMLKQINFDKKPVKKVESSDPVGSSSALEELEEKHRRELVALQEEHNREVKRLQEQGGRKKEKF